MTSFLTSLLSKKLGFAVAVEALIQSLHTTADTKAMASALVAVGFLVAQAYVDAHAAKDVKPAEFVVTIPPPKESSQ